VTGRAADDFHDALNTSVTPGSRIQRLEHEGPGITGSPVQPLGGKA
jgi:hypothetical protein